MCEPRHAAHFEDQPPAGELSFDSVCHFLFRDCRREPAAKRGRGTTDAPPPAATPRGVDGRRTPSCARRSMAQPEVFDQFAVPVQIGPLEVLEEPAAASHHLQEAAAAVMVVPVGVEMDTQVIDPGGEKGNLDLGAPGPVIVGLVLGYDRLLVDTHFVPVYCASLQTRRCQADSL